MPISSVSPSSYQPYLGASQAVKQGSEGGSAADVAAPAAPDSDAKKTSVEPDASASTASGSKESAAPNMYKINPDGTVGPLHLRRHPNSQGVIHA